MRRRLVLLALATTSMVAIAFLAPLGLLVRTLARDRAVNAAEQDASAIAPVLALSDDPQDITTSVETTKAGMEGRLTVFLADGATVGAPATSSPAVELAQRGRSFSTSAPGGVQILRPVVAPGRPTAVVRVFVPSGLLNRGVARSWALLTSLGIVLVLIAVFIADRLGRSVVRPVRELSDAAQRLGQGQLDVRVRSMGPAEIADVGIAFNRMAARVAELLATERELVADLSHRLRTPLTALRLDIEAVGQTGEVRRLLDDLDRLEATVNEIIRSARQPVRGGLGVVTDLAQTTRSRVEFWSVLAEEQSRPWTLDCSHDNCPVSVEGSELEAALDAVLGNVFTHTPEGTPFHVRVERGDDGRTVLTVEDEGPGMDGRGDGQDVVRRGVSGSGSTGLGLDIARRTAETAGGQLLIDSRPGGGARVRLEFPAPSSE